MSRGDDLDGTTAFELLLERMCDASNNERIARQSEQDKAEEAAAMRHARDKAHETALKLQRQITDMDPDGGAKYIRESVVAMMNAHRQQHSDSPWFGETMIKRLEEIADKLDPIPF